MLWSGVESRHGMVKCPVEQICIQTRHKPSQPQSPKIRGKVKRWSISLQLLPFSCLLGLRSALGLDTLRRLHSDLFDCTAFTCLDTLGFCQVFANAIWVSATGPPV